jgi:hypothetical protein
MAETATFNHTEYIQKANEREAAGRQTSGTAVLDKPEPKAETKAEPAAAEPAKQDDSHESVKLPRSVRRELNRLREEAAEARGQLTAMREIMTRGGKLEPEAAKPAAEDAAAKPARDKFATDAEYTEALATWSAKQVTDQAEQSRQTEDRIRAMSAKAQEDMALIPDWEAHQRDAVENGPEFKPAEHGTLMLLLGTSEYQALALDYFATHADEFEEMLALTPKPAKQIEEFRALEGHLKRVYSQLKKGAPKPKEESSTAEGAKKEEKPAAAKLPKPSESAAARGGSAPDTTVSPYLEDGKTINPAWKEMRNQRERGR